MYICFIYVNELKLIKQIKTKMSISVTKLNIKREHYNIYFLGEIQKVKSSYFFFCNSNITKRSH